MRKLLPALSRVAFLCLFAGVAACGSSETGSGGGTHTGPCNSSGAEALDPIECHLGVCNVLVAACQNGEPASCPPAEPSASEKCGDGLDNDCNGQVDDGCPCKDGATKPCYSGSPETRHVGACNDGVQACQNGSWGACKGDIRPSKEVCDSLDDNCDGVIDEGCACKEGETQPCYGGPKATSGVGMCVMGTQACSGGAWGQCQGSVLPQPEACDGADNDCNGEVDNGDFGQGMPCDVAGGKGACKAGVTACIVGGLWCMPNVKPMPEVCDGIDSDCDGVVDNGDFCCANGMKGGPESDVDCGAACDVKCAAGKMCHTPDDCTSGVCNNAVCAP